MSSRFASVIIILGLLLTVSGIVLVIGVPILAQIDAARTAQEQAEEQAIALEERQHQLVDVSADKEINHRFAERLKTHIPENDQGDQFIFRIEELSHYLDLAALVLATSDTTAKKDRSLLGPLPAGTSEVSFSLEIAGAFTEVVTFLKDLEVGDRLIDIRQVTFVGRGGGGVTAQIDGRLFFKKSLPSESQSTNLVIDPQIRNRFLAPTASRAIPDLPNPAEGRPDPFAPIE